MLTKEQHAGAVSIFKDALQTESEDRVLIIHDEFTEKLAEILSTIGISEINAKVHLHCVSVSKQAEFPPRTASRLSRPIRRAIDETSRVIVLQKRDPKTNHFRLCILEYASRHHQCRAASMPGMEIDHLRFCNANLVTITERCLLLASLLARSTHAELITESIDGTPLVLDIPIGKYKPIQSTGLILPGHWGNVPSGETFIVPDSCKTEGEIAIDGSLVNYPIPHGKKLIIEIKEGKVQYPIKASKCFNSHIHRLLFNKKGKETYKNCSVVSELGIGTNENISEFTGLPLFDEKILGTVHLGLGRSKQYRGPTHCEVHNDFTTSVKKLSIDSILVIDDGNFVLNYEDVHPNWKNMSTKSFSPRHHFEFGRHTYECIKKSNRYQAFMTWLSPRGGSNIKTLVGDQETAEISAVILREMSHTKNPISCQYIIKKAPNWIKPESIAPTLDILLKYGLIKCREKSNEYNQRL